MSQLLAELRALRAATGVRQHAIAERMDIGEKVLSSILSGERKTLPADFEARFRAAVAALANEKAQAIETAAEVSAQALRQAAGVVELEKEAVAA